MPGYHSAATLMGPIRNLPQPSAEVESDDCAESRNSPSSSAARRHYRANREFRRGPWSEAEDQALIDIVRQIGPYDWATVCKNVRGRNSKQCRERWFQNLRPDLDHTTIRPEEVRIIEDMYTTCGPKWAEIARALGNRSDNAVKNWWNGNQNRKKRRDRDRTRAEDYTRAPAHGSSNYHQSVPLAHHQPRPPFPPIETTNYQHLEQYQQYRNGHPAQSVTGTYRPDALPSPTTSDTTDRGHNSYTLSPASHHTSASSSTSTPTQYHRPVLPPPQAHGSSDLSVPQLPLPSRHSDVHTPRIPNNSNGHGGTGYEVSLPPLQRQACVPNSASSGQEREPRSASRSNGGEPRISVQSLLG